MRAVVTGATGFVGSHLIDRLLTEGVDLTILTRANSEVTRTEGREVAVARVDYAEAASIRDAVAGADVVYHIAGVIKALRTDTYRSGNIAATRNVAEACASTHPRPSKLVVLSSQAACGPSWPSRARTEMHAPAPTSPYGASKLMAERAALSVSDPIETVILRPTTVYGPRDPALEIVFRLAELGIAPALPTNPEISLIHVTDLVRGIITAGHATLRHGRAYFLGHPEPYRFDDIVSAIVAANGSGPAIRVPVPTVLILLGGMLATIAQTLLKQPRPFDFAKAMDIVRPAWVVDVSRVRAELGFTASIGHAEGLRSTADWYRDNALR